MAYSEVNATLPDWSMTLEGLSAEQIATVEAGFVGRNVAAGALVFNQGEAGDDFFVVRRGRVRLFHTSAAGKEYMSGIWSTGYPLGLISALLGQPRIQSVQALDPLTLQAMSRTALLALMTRLPAFSINVACLLAAMAHFSIERSGPLALDSSAARLGRVLLRLARPEADDSSGRHVVQDIRQDELARMVGATRPWVTLTLAAFERRGLLERRRGYLAIVDRAAFEQHVANLSAP